VNENNIGNPGRAEKKLMKCEDIQPLVFDYMNHELGEGRSAVVREHLRKCKECQDIARNIQATMDLLHKASMTGNPQAERLTDNRRKKIIWAFTHPVRSWIAKNLFVFSFIAAIFVFVGVFSFSSWLVRTHFAPKKEGRVVEVILVTRGQTNVVYDETKRWSPGGQTNPVAGGTNAVPPGGGKLIP